MGSAHTHIDQGLGSIAESVVYRTIRPPHPGLTANPTTLTNTLSVGNPAYVTYNLIDTPFIIQGVDVVELLIADGVCVHLHVCLH